ncbi:MAG TPA: Zn-ribbon domain-containing OB-fold protein [Dehalococcoidia bacterium]|nr:Zn-ribbon domain-containing OB-fold protein [Dehalococcoidia bacterium]
MTQEEEIVIMPGAWNLPFRHTAGRFASRFFRELRDSQKIYGVRCPQCRRVLLPPRPMCERCFASIEEWVEVGHQGTLEAFTICYVPFLGLPPPPVGMVVVKLDGADTCLQHILSGVDLSDPDKARDVLKIGMRVEAVWREQRRGEILDIQYFKPI